MTTFLNKEEALADAELEKCKNLKIGKLTIEGISYTPSYVGGVTWFTVNSGDPAKALKLDKDYTADLIVTGVDGKKLALSTPKSFKIESSGGNAELDSDYITISSTDSGLSITWPAYTYDHIQGPVQDTTIISVSDEVIGDDGLVLCTQEREIRIDRILKYPEIAEELLKTLESIYADICFEYVNSKTNFRIYLVDQSDQYLAWTGEIKNNQWEDACTNQFFKLYSCPGGVCKKPDGGTYPMSESTAKVGDIAKIWLLLNDDPSGWGDMEAKVKSFKLKSEYWEAELSSPSGAIYECSSAGSVATHSIKSEWYLGGDNNDKCEVDGNSETWKFIMPPLDDWK